MRRSNTKLEAMYHPDLLGGISTISGNVKLRETKDEGMYQKIKKPVWKPFEVSFIPYFTWSNRGESEMSVFMPVIWEN